MCLIKQYTRLVPAQEVTMNKQEHPVDMLYPLELKADVRNDASFKVIFVIDESESSDEPVALHEVDLCLN
jgi:hypothetical protein